MGMHAQMPKLRLLLTRKGGGKLKLEYEKSADSIEREMKGKKKGLECSSSWALQFSYNLERPSRAVASMEPVASLLQ
jgi:hypothetical protein